MGEEGAAGQESRGEAEKPGNGGLLTTAGMKVCRQSGSEEFWECKTQAAETTTRIRARRRSGKGSRNQKRKPREQPSFKRG